MNFKLIASTIFIIFLIPSLGFAGARISTSNAYVISIGINNYKSPFARLANAVNDATQLTKKIEADAKKATLGLYKSQSDNTRNIAGSSLPNRSYSESIDSVYTYLLLDENATIENIKSAFKEVARLATPSDYFIFYFGGFSIEKSANKTVLIPYMESDWGDNIQFVAESKMITLQSIATLMEQISCDNQLIISEAGDGSSFAKNLIASFFESNPLLSTGTSRNRIILTTTGLGLDGLSCKGQSFPNGPIAHFLLQSESMFDIFWKTYSFEHKLMEQDIACFGEKKYLACYVEKEYQRLFVNPIQKATRGVEVEEELAPEETKEAPKTYALVVGTNNYAPDSKWDNLKNPINDASAIAQLLEQKYNASVTVLNNPDRDSLLYAIIKYKNIMHVQDKFILFIAGHGYFSNELSDGFIVTSDSRSLASDPFMNSYLQMASLNRMVDNLPAKNVFVIFDICFGATFDLNAANADPNRYNSLTLDISLEEFITRQNDKISRMFLASGRYSVPDYWNNSLNHSPFADKLIKALITEKYFTSPGRLLSSLEGNVTAPILKQFGKHETGADVLIAVQ